MDASINKKGYEAILVLKKITIYKVRTNLHREICETAKLRKEPGLIPGSFCVSL